MTEVNKIAPKIREKSSFGMDLGFSMVNRPYLPLVATL
jgi:hypothetical protein